MGTRSVRGPSTGVAGNRHMQPGIIARGPELTEVKGKKCMASTFLQTRSRGYFRCNISPSQPEPTVTPVIRLSGPQLQPQNRNAARSDYQMLLIDIVRRIRTLTQIGPPSRYFAPRRP